MADQNITILIVLVLLLLVYFYYLKPMYEEKTEIVPDVKSNLNAPCSVYGDNDRNLSDFCLKSIWAGNGCTNENEINTPEYNAFWKPKTKWETTWTMRQWATMKNELQNERCYGSDKTKWPA